MRSKPSSFETLCDILYLLIMIALSVNLLLKDGFGNPESRTYHLAGFMVVILILGDSKEKIRQDILDGINRNKNEG